ncbi:transposable element Tcb1 transposase [Trichonephila clavipes]|nr:transposable element Tcb1 transposase [Trichonephila clavipes]
MRAAGWNEVVFTDESRICLQHHDGRFGVWRHRRERMLNSCVMHHKNGSASGIMVWGGIGYHSRTPLVRIAGTLKSQCYISKNSRQRQTKDCQTRSNKFGMPAKSAEPMTIYAFDPSLQPPVSHTQEVSGGPRRRSPSDGGSRRPNNSPAPSNPPIWVT